MSAPPTNPANNSTAEASKPRYSIVELLEKITPYNQPESFDDAPVGEEEL